MENNETIMGRISDLRGFCASNRLSYREVADNAGLNYGSVLQHMRTGFMSADRIEKLEKSAIDLAQVKQGRRAVHS